MSYTEDAVLAKLSALNETQESIVTVAQWIMFHRRYANTTAQLWLRRLQDAGSGKRLNLIYLANEVVQQSKARKKDDFVVAFSPIIAEATSTAYKGATNEVQQKLRRVVDVWRQRQIFNQATQEDVESKIDEVDKSRPATKRGQLGGSLFSDSNSAAPTELQPLVPLQIAVSKADLAQKPALTAANDEYASQTDASKPSPSLPVQANRLNVLLKSLQTAEHAVSESIRTRNDLIAGLESLLSTHRAALAQDTSTHADLSTRRAAIEARGRDVEDQIARGLGDDADEPAPERPEIERFTPPPTESQDPGSTTPTEALPPDYNPFFEPLPEGHTAPLELASADPRRARAKAEAVEAHPRPGSADGAANGVAKRRRMSRGMGEEFAGFGGDKEDALEGLDEEVVGMLG